MLELTFTSLKEKFSKLDWSFIKGSTQLSIWIAVARVLGMAFSLVLARVFSPADYGSIQFAITLAALASIGTEPFGMHVMAQSIASHMDQPGQAQKTLTNVATIQIGVFLVTAAISAPLIWWQAAALMPGILVILLGQTIFYSYWGLARGFAAPGRLAAAYVGSNLVQILLVFLLISSLHIHSPLLALTIYGGSYFLPLFLLQRFWPLYSFSISTSLIDRKYLVDILKFSIPIWASQIGYVLFNAVDILLLEHFSGSSAVGIYRLNKTIAMAFIFVPQGIASILMPKVASTDAKTHGSLLKRSVGIVLLVDIVILIFYLLLIQPFVREFFGTSYIVSISIAILMASGSILFGLDTIVASILVG
ncbi:MAG: oligosaccharide flippase family protein, partial [Chloroflexota bacterium]